LPKSLHMLRSRCRSSLGAAYYHIPVAAAAKGGASVPRTAASHEQHLDIPATAPRADQPLAPFGHHEIGPEDLGQICGIGPILVVAVGAAAPHDQAGAGLGGSA